MAQRSVLQSSLTETRLRTPSGPRLSVSQAQDRFSIRWALCGLPAPSSREPAVLTELSKNRAAALGQVLTKYTYTIDFIAWNCQTAARCHVLSSSVSRPSAIAPLRWAGGEENSSANYRNDYTANAFITSLLPISSSTGDLLVYLHGEEKGAAEDPVGRGSELRAALSLPPRSAPPAPARRVPALAVITAAAGAPREREAQQRRN